MSKAASKVTETTETTEAATACRGNTLMQQKRGMKQWWDGTMWSYSEFFSVCQSCENDWQIKWYIQLMLLKFNMYMGLATNNQRTREHSTASISCPLHESSHHFEVNTVVAGHRPWLSELNPSGISHSKNSKWGEVDGPRSHHFSSTGIHDSSCGTFPMRRTPQRGKQEVGVGGGLVSPHLHDFWFFIVISWTFWSRSDNKNPSLKKGEPSVF